MFRPFRFVAPALGLLVIVSAASADPKNPTYDDDILPIFKQHCFNCHNNDKQRGGLNVATYAEMKQGGSSGEVLEPGDPDKSRIFTLTAHTEEPKMPPNGNKIPDDQIALLKLWVEQGGRENSGSKVAVKPKVDISLKSMDLGKPDGPPPMPIIEKLKRDPFVVARRPGAVLAMASSPWSPLVAVAGQKQVLLYHTDTGALLGLLPFEEGQINSLRFSRNGKMLLAAGGRNGASGAAVLYNIESGEVITKVGESEADAILSADLSPDQSMIAVGTPTRVVRVYSTADGSVLHTIRKHTEWVTAVEYSPDGVLLATGDRNGGIFIWEGATAREFYNLDGHNAMIADISWRPDSNVVASASEDGNIRLWEMENGKQLKNWAAHSGGAMSVRYGMDGKIASAGRDRRAKLWSGDGNLEKQFDQLPDLGLQSVLSHDSKRVIAGDWSGKVTVWTVDGKAERDLDVNPAPLAERVKAAESVVAKAQAKADQANKQLQDAQAKVAKLNEELQQAKKAMTDTANASKQAAEEVTKQTAALDNAKKADQQAKDNLNKLTAQNKSAQDALTKAKAEAEKDEKKQEAFKKAEELAKKAASEFEAAKKAADQAEQALKAAESALTAANQKAGELAKVADEAAKTIPNIEKAIQAANEAVKPLAEAANVAKAELDQAKNQLEQVKSPTVASANE